MIFINRHFLLIVLCLVGIAAGQAVFNTLDIPASVRSLSLTNGAGAVPAVVLGGNPAGMDSDGISAGGQFFVYPADITGQQLYYTTRTNTGIASAVLTVIDFGRFSDSVTGDEFTAKDMILRAGYKSVFRHHISWGISLGGIRSNIQEYHAWGLFMNAGMRSRFLDNRAGLGISVENTGRMLSTYAGRREPVNGLIRYSGFYRPLHIPAVLSLDYLDMDTGSSRVITAAEFNLPSGFSLWISTSSERNILAWGEVFHTLTSGIAGGIRLPVKNYIVDLGFQNLGPAGNVLGMGVGLQWK